MMKICKNGVKLSSQDLCSMVVKMTNFPCSWTFNPMTTISAAKQLFLKTYSPKRSTKWKFKLWWHISCTVCLNQLELIDLLRKPKITSLKQISKKFHKSNQELPMKQICNRQLQLFKTKTKFQTKRWNSQKSSATNPSSATLMSHHFQRRKKKGKRKKLRNKWKILCHTMLMSFKNRTNQEISKIIGKSSLKKKITKKVAHIEKWEWVCPKINWFQICLNFLAKRKNIVSKNSKTF